MATSGTRGALSAAVPWIVSAAVLTASFALIPSARSRAVHAIERATRACVPGQQTPLLDGPQHYAPLAQRFFEQANDATRTAADRLGAAEVAWAASALARDDLVGEAFDERFSTLLGYCDEMPDEPAFVALALTALRDHRACTPAGLRASDSSDDVLLESLAAVSNAVDPDNGAVLVLLTQAALEAGRTLEARDLLTRAACAASIDEYFARRVALAEHALVAVGVEPLVAREFLVREAFDRPAARAATGLAAISERFGLLLLHVDEPDTRLAIERVAMRVAATAALRSDAKQAAEVARVAKDGAHSNGRADAGLDTALAAAERWLERSNRFVRPVRGIHDLLFVFAVVFAVIGVCSRSRRGTHSAAPPRRQSGVATSLATAGALVMPLFTLVALRMTWTWPFTSGTRFVEIVCEPHPALLLLPLTVVPFALVVALAARHAQRSPFIAVRKLMFTLAVAAALCFAWTTSAIDAIEAKSAQALANFVQFDADASSE